jgi:hypothetical protein
MDIQKMPYRRKLISALVILGTTLLLAAVNGSIISAQLIAQQDTTLKHSHLNRVVVTEPFKAKAFPPSISLLDFTSVATIYLPLIPSSPSRVPTNCNPTSGSGGLPPGSYQTTVAGLDAIIVIGQGYKPEEPTYLSFFIHGNSGDYTWFKSSSNLVNKFVNEHNWIFVAPRSPMGTSWSAPWDASLNEAFAQVLDEMFAKYNVCRNTIIGSSRSGGSIFWTGFFFPEKGGDYPAHVTLLCGGLAAHNKESKQKVRDLGQNAEVVSRSTFDYTYGTEDYLYKYITGSIKLYSEAGFKVDSMVLPGVSHCMPFNFSFERIVDSWEGRIQELGLE